MAIDTVVVRLAFATFMALVFGLLTASNVGWAAGLTVGLGVFVIAVGVSLAVLALVMRRKR